MHEQGHLNWVRLFKNKPNIEGKVGFGLLGWGLFGVLSTIKTCHAHKTVHRKCKAIRRSNWKNWIQESDLVPVKFPAKIPYPWYKTKLFRQSCCFPRSSSKSARAWKCKDSVMSFVIHTYCKFSEQTRIHKQHSWKYPIQGIMRVSTSLLPNFRSGAAH